MSKEPTEEDVEKFLSGERVHRPPTRDQLTKEAEWRLGQIANEVLHRADVLTEKRERTGRGLDELAECDSAEHLSLYYVVLRWRSARNEYYAARDSATRTILTTRSAGDPGKDGLL